MSEEGLRRLLDRARPVELEPLERLLSLESFGLRGHRAAAIERSLRRIGGPHSPQWASTLRRTLEKRGRGTAGDTELLERRILAVFLEEGKLDAAQVGELALLAPWVPGGLIPAQWIYRFKRNVLGRMFWFLMPLVWLRNRDERQQEERLPMATLAVAELRAKLKGRVTLAIVGPPSSGKDSALRALFGVDTGNIDPVAGATREAGVHQLSARLSVLNTPGHGDVEQTLSDETQSYLDHADLYLVVLNAEGGLQAPDRALLDTVQARARPTLVALNKVDLMREGELPRMLAHVRERAPGLQVVPCSFDPYLAPEPLGIDEVWRWIEAQVGEQRAPHAAPSAAEQEE